MIPKIIHQIWIGNLEPPVSLMDSWKTKNPDFEYILWDEEKIEKENFASQEKVIEMKEYCGKADIIRYEILYRYGGIYVDADSYCIGRLNNSLFLNNSFAVYENENVRKGLIATGVLGFEPEHVLLKNILDIIVNLNINSGNTNRSPWQTVGPLLFTKVYNKTFPKIKIYPSYMFYPEHYSGITYKGHGKVFGYQFWSSTRKNYNSIDEIDVPPWLFELPSSSVSVFIVLEKNNSFKDFKKTMDSLVNQEGNFYMEIIIVDNNSKDYLYFDLINEISYYKRTIKDSIISNVTYYYDISLGRAYNVCMRRSNSDYVTFASVGDFLHPQKIYNQINFLKISKTTCVGTQVKEITKTESSVTKSITSYPSCSIRQWKKSKSMKIMDTKSLMFQRKFFSSEMCDETINYPCILNRALTSFITKGFFYNLKSVEITREKRNDKYPLYTIYNNSNEERKLFRDILQ